MNCIAHRDRSGIQSSIGQESGERLATLMEGFNEILERLPVEEANANEPGDAGEGGTDAKGYIFIVDDRPQTEAVKQPLARGNDQADHDCRPKDL
jgi:hypothetical protein